MLRVGHSIRNNIRAPTLWNISFNLNRHCVSWNLWSGQTVAFINEFHLNNNCLVKTQYGIKK